MMVVPTNHEFRISIRARCARCGQQITGTGIELMSTGALFHPECIVVYLSEKKSNRRKGTEVLE